VVRIVKKISLFPSPFHLLLDAGYGRDSFLKEALGCTPAPPGTTFRSQPRGHFNRGKPGDILKEV